MHNWLIFQAEQHCPTLPNSRSANTYRWIGCRAGELRTSTNDDAAQSQKWRAGKQDDIRFEQQTGNVFQIVGLPFDKRRAVGKKVYYGQPLKKARDGGPRLAGVEKISYRRWSWRTWPAFITI
jgi:hypothetical protein